MVEKNEVLFILTMEDLLEVAREDGIPADVITDDIFGQVKKGVEWGLECWSEVVSTALAYALKS